MKGKKSINLGFWRILFATLMSIGFLVTGYLGYNWLYASTGAVVVMWIAFELLLISNLTLQMFSMLSQFFAMLNAQGQQQVNAKVPKKPHNELRVLTNKEMCKEDE